MRRRRLKLFKFISHYIKPQWSSSVDRLTHWHTFVCYLGRVSRVTGGLHLSPGTRSNEPAAAAGTRHLGIGDRKQQRVTWQQDGVGEAPRWRRDGAQSSPATGRFRLRFERREAGGSDARYRCENIQGRTGQIGRRGWSDRKHGWAGRLPERTGEIILLHELLRVRCFDTELGQLTRLPPDVGEGRDPLHFAVGKYSQRQFVGPATGPPGREKRNDGAGYHPAGWGRSRFGADPTCRQRVHAGPTAGSDRYETDHAPSAAMLWRHHGRCRGGRHYVIARQCC